MSDPEVFIHRLLRNHSSWFERCRCESVENISVISNPFSLHRCSFIASIRTGDSVITEKLHKIHDTMNHPVSY